MAQVSYSEKGYVDRPREDGIVQDRPVIVNLRNCLGELLQAADYLVNIAKPDEEAAIIAANLQSIVHDDDAWRGQVSALDSCIRIVRDITINPIDRSMVEAIHRIGHQMGLKTVAEYVESEQTLALLLEIGVDYVQGNAVHLPEPLENLCEKS